MPRRSFVGKIVNQARPIPFNSKWNTSAGGIFGGGTQDRFGQLQTTQTQGTLYAIVQLLSTGSQVQGGWKMYRKQKDGRVRYSKSGSDIGSDQRVEVLQHQALKLWNKPNPFMDGSEFREVGWQHMELAGEWYWVLNRGVSGTGIPIEMWPVRPDRMEPVPDKDKFLSGWVYTGPNGESVPLSTDEVIQMRYPHPTDMYRGLSAIQAIMFDIDSSKYSAEWSRNFFLNSAQPGGVVTFGKRLTDDEFTEFTDRWRESHQGVARGHRVGVLEQGAQWTPNTYSLRDMQFSELRQVTSDMIRMAYRIHQAMLGNSDDVNRANAETAEEVHVAWQEVPRLRRMRSKLNGPYLDMFKASDDVEMDFDDPMPTSSNDANDEMTAKSTAVQLLVGAGYDPEEVLEAFGLPPIKWKGPPKPPAPPKPAVDPVTGKPALPPGTQQPVPNPDPKNPPAQTKTRQQQEAETAAKNMADFGPMLREAFSSVRHNGHRKEPV